MNIKDIIKDGEGSVQLIAAIGCQCKVSIVRKKKKEIDCVMRSWWMGTEK